MYLRIGGGGGVLTRVRQQRVTLRARGGRHLGGRGSKMKREEMVRICMQIEKINSEFFL